MNYYAMNKKHAAASCRYCYVKFKADYAYLIKLRLCIPDATWKIVTQEICLKDRKSSS